MENGNPLIISIGSANKVAIERPPNGNHNSEQLEDSQSKVLEVKIIERLKDKEYNYIKPLDWMDDRKLEKVFIPPIIKEDQEVNSNCKELSIDDIVTKLDNCKCIQIEGEAGCGKTTTAFKIIYDWAKNEPYMKRFKFVIHIPLAGVTNTHKIEDVVLDDICFSNDEKNKVKDLLQANEKGILFLLDGVNDIESIKIYDYIKKFKDQFNLSKFILLSRSLSCKVKNKDRLYHEKYYLHGFNETCVQNYIKQFFNGNYTKARELEQKAKTFDVKKICGTIPLFWHLICILHENQNLPRTLTELYTSIIMMFSQHYWKKIVSDLDLDETKIPDYVKHALISLGKMVFTCLQKKSTEYTKEKLDKLCGMQNTEIILNLGLLKKKKKSSNKQQYYQPVHTTFLEYVAAFYLAHCSKNMEDNLEVLFSTPHLLHSKSLKQFGCTASYLMVFLCGLVQKKERCLFFTKLKSQNLYNGFLKLAFLLWEASVDRKNLKKTLKDANELLAHRIGSIWDIKWLFVKQRKLNEEDEININVEILENILQSPNCPVKSYSLDNVHLYLFNQTTILFKKFLNSLKTNTTIESVKFDNEMHFKQDFASEEYLKIYKDCFVEIKKMKNLHHVSFNSDIFIVNEQHNFEVLSHLFDSFSSVDSLESLKITAYSPHDVKLGIDYQDEINLTIPKSKIKAIKSFTLNDGHIKQLTNFERKNIKNLYLAQIKLKEKDSFQNFISFLTEISLEELHLPYLQFQNDDENSFENTRILSSLINEMVLKLESTLTHLDLHGTVLSLDNANSISVFLERNENLKCLNLAGCFQMAKPVMIMFENVRYKSLEMLNIASNVEFTNENIIKFCTNYLEKAYSQPKLKTLILSGWKIKITFDTLKILGDVFKCFTDLEYLCLSNATFTVDLLPADQDILEHFKNILSCHKYVNVISFELHLSIAVLSHQGSLSREDSGIYMSNPSSPEHKEITDPIYSICEGDKHQTWNGNNIKEHFSGKISCKICSNKTDLLEVRSEDL